MTTLEFDLPEISSTETVRLEGREVTTWEVRGHPMIVRRTFDPRDLTSPLSFDFVHGGYLRQLVEEAPNGLLELSARANVNASEESTLSRIQSGDGPSVTYVLSVVAPGSKMVCTLQVSYPLSYDENCKTIAIDCLRSAQIST
jgi:hypothetical protein